MSAERHQSVVQEVKATKNSNASLCFGPTFMKTLVIIAIGSELSPKNCVRSTLFPITAFDLYGQAPSSSLNSESKILGVEVVAEGSILV